MADDVIPREPEALHSALIDGLKQEAREERRTALLLRQSKKSKLWRVRGHPSWAVFVKDVFDMTPTTAATFMDAADWPEAWVAKYGTQKMGAFTKVARLAGYEPPDLPSLESCLIPLDAGDPVTFAVATSAQVAAARTVLARKAGAAIAPRDELRLRVKEALAASVAGQLAPNQIEVKNGPEGLRIKLRDVPREKAKAVFTALAQAVRELKAQGITGKPADAAQGGKP
ncbi:MAG: hypothetical protein HY928_09675 [Elusimicrobia bacterium]|nr:hypothetical protein [Elusimicrobiota bacterium]